MIRQRIRSQKNRGFSLVEVLVTISILAIVSVTIIRTFFVSANINNKSKLQKNATDIAQNVSESFINISLPTLLDKYSHLDSETNRYCENYLEKDGKIVFQNIGDGTNSYNNGTSDIPYFEGPDSEKFFVTVVLDSNSYSKKNDDDEDKINDYVIPNLSSLISNDNITIFKQFSKYDDRVISSLKNSYPEIGDISRDDIQKSNRIEIKQSKNAKDASKTDYEIELNVTYTYKADKKVSYDFVISSGTLSKTEQLSDIYMVYSSFNSTITGSTDSIDIACNGSQKPVNVYLVEQKNGTAGLSASNIKFTGNSDDKFYSNVAGEDTSPITEGKQNLMKMYSVDVYIRCKKEDTNNINSYLDDSTNDTDVIASVSAAKEE